MGTTSAFTSGLAAPVLCGGGVVGKAQKEQGLGGQGYPGSAFGQSALVGGGGRGQLGGRAVAPEPLEKPGSLSGQKEVATVLA